MRMTVAYGGSEAEGQVKFIINVTTLDIQILTGL